MTLQDRPAGRGWRELRGHDSLAGQDRGEVGAGGQEESEEERGSSSSIEQRGGSPSVELPSLHLALASASTHHTHLHGPHQLFCWSSPKRARHFLGALRSDAATGKGSQQRG